MKYHNCTIIVISSILLCLCATFITTKAAAAAATTEQKVATFNKIPFSDDTHSNKIERQDSIQNTITSLYNLIQESQFKILILIIFLQSFRYRESTIFDITKLSWQEQKGLFPRYRISDHYYY
ncbi:hypothetical protein DFA_07595 [Cavenderia fasciculata]|uniref:Uncharacterized protein n=1 Tax=Cavenderia fasciculata TaxID=261658 RepID=F4Q631_CACFS|nr:uncharacterized protein DFA_07595 [Cavenderia fasciculata]EGG16617.1 hypothetical protein DFA_07595 [Cavenderia fasciculata]|eukprot:XP_004355091.1 hypothetical protein DFA_07595 [Cavenderia fasciculata]